VDDVVPAVDLEAQQRLSVDDRAVGLDRVERGVDYETG
jgi:hypothetical protein